MARTLFAWLLTVQQNNGMVVSTFLTRCHNNGHTIWAQVHPARSINGLTYLRVMIHMRATMNLLVNELRPCSTGWRGGPKTKKHRKGGAELSASLLTGALAKHLDVERRLVCHVSFLQLGSSFCNGLRGRVLRVIKP